MPSGKNPPPPLTRAASEWRSNPPYRDRQFVAITRAKLSEHPEAAPNSIFSSLRSRSSSRSPQPPVAPKHRPAPPDSSARQRGQSQRPPAASDPGKTGEASRRHCDYVPGPPPRKHEQLHSGRNNPHPSCGVLVVHRILLLHFLRVLVQTIDAASRLISSASIRAPNYNYVPFPADRLPHQSAAAVSPAPASAR